jgi:tetratricopeptide (TPR) repeat protein
MGWWVAGVFFVGLVLILALPVLRRDTVPESSTPFAAPAGGGAPPDISNMTPRQAADRLYDRVMRADASGNVAEVQQFLPMAIDAHEMARPLDLDGLFHLALLHQTRGDHVSALAVSGEMLGQNPDYLLGLSVAAESSAAMEDAETARGHYERFLEAYDRELSRGLEEYEIHSVTLTTTRQSAIAATAP